MPKNKHCLSVAETANHLGTCRKTVYTMIHNGEIPFIRVGRKYIVPTEELKRWLRRSSNGQAKL